MKDTTLESLWDEVAEPGNLWEDLTPEMQTYLRNFASRIRANLVIQVLKKRREGP